MSYTGAELEFLLTHEFHHPELALTKSSQLADVAFLRSRYGAHARAVAELLTARRSAKLPPHWLMDSDSAQQATPPAVAAWRAEYLRSLGVTGIVDITCSIGTEGAGALARGLGYVGADLDQVRLRMASHNVPTGAFLRADALVPAVAVPPGQVVIADPARRAGGRRITDPAKLIPPLPDLLAVWQGSGQELAVKCAPGLDFSTWEGQVVVTSVDGAVKEACLYTPGLATGRRAVLLTQRRNAASNSGNVTDIPGDGDVSVDVDVSADVIDSSLPDEVAVGGPGRYIIDPDGAVVRAGLVRHYAYREGLWQLDQHLAFLTGDRLPVGRSGFEFLEQVSLKKLKAALAAHDCGAVEILVRGVNVDPDQLRNKLNLRGTKSLAVVIARIGGAGDSGAVAFICGPRVSSEEN